MQRKQFTITVNAPADRVWEILWNTSTYNEWTAVFAEGSRVETNWQKGSKVVFGDGKGNGMIATIAETIPPRFMSFKHLGALKDGVEDFDSEATKQWAGAMENYTLEEVDKQTRLTVDIDITEEYLDYFDKTWPRAMDKIKEIAER